MDLCGVYYPDRVYWRQPAERGSGDLPVLPPPLLNRQPLLRGCIFSFQPPLDLPGSPTPWSRRPRGPLRASRAACRRDRAG